MLLDRFGKDLDQFGRCVCSFGSSNLKSGDRGLWSHQILDMYSVSYNNMRFLRSAALFLEPLHPGYHLSKNHASKVLLNPRPAPPSVTTVDSNLCLMAKQKTSKKQTVIKNPPYKKKNKMQAKKPVELYYSCLSPAN